MMSKVKIVAVEGVDGVGKSSFCELLSRQLGTENVVVAKTPHGELNNLALMAKAESPLASLCAYLIGNICISNQFKDSKLLILDRYILSTLVYHEKVLRRINYDIFKIIELTNVIKPALTILLEADLSIIINRLRKRKEISKSNQDYIELQKKFDEYTNNPEMEPWLGKIVKFRSESYLDHQYALESVLDILNTM